MDASGGLNLERMWNHPGASEKIDRRGSDRYIVRDDSVDRVEILE